MILFVWQKKKTKNFLKLMDTLTQYVTLKGSQFACELQRMLMNRLNRDVKQASKK